VDGVEVGAAWALLDDGSRYRAESSRRSTPPRRPAKRPASRRLPSAGLEPESSPRAGEETRTMRVENADRRSTGRPARSQGDPLADFARRRSILAAVGTGLVLITAACDDSAPTEPRSPQTAARVVINDPAGRPGEPPVRNWTPWPSDWFPRRRGSGSAPRRHRGRRWCRINETGPSACNPGACALRQLLQFDYWYRPVAVSAAVFASRQEEFFGGPRGRRPRYLSDHCLEIRVWGVERPAVLVKASWARGRLETFNVRPDRSATLDGESSWNRMIFGHQEACM
jgi:hypothetical protein